MHILEGVLNGRGVLRLPQVAFLTLGRILKNLSEGQRDRTSHCTDIHDVGCARQLLPQRRELRLWDEFRDLNKSDVADVKNSGGRAAGSITAGWFLREFVDGFPWAHLDIAGTAYTDRETAGSPKGPTGLGVRLFSEFILGRAGG